MVLLFDICVISCYICFIYSLLSLSLHALFSSSPCYTPRTSIGWVSTGWVIFFISIVCSSEEARLNYGANDSTRKDLLDLISNHMSTAFTLEDECPVGWPENMSINMEYPLAPEGQESATGLVQRIYLEGLWLPDVRESTFCSCNCTHDTPSTVHNARPSSSSLPPARSDPFNNRAS